MPRPGLRRRCAVVRGSVRDTGSAVAGSRASMSLISSTPPPRTAATASTIRCRRVFASVAPTPGPSSSTSLREDRTERANVALPTPAGPVMRTPRCGEAPSVREQFWFVECQAEPLGQLGCLRLRADEVIQRTRRCRLDRGCSGTGDKRTRCQRTRRAGTPS